MGIQTRSRQKSGVRNDTKKVKGVTKEQHQALASAFLWQPKPEKNPESLKQLAREVKMKEEDVVAWAGKMRRRMGVGRLVAEDSSGIELEEDVVPEEVKKGGGSPLEYCPEDEDYDEIVDDSEMETTAPEEEVSRDADETKDAPQENVKKNLLRRYQESVGNPEETNHMDSTEDIIVDDAKNKVNAKKTESERPEEAEARMSTDEKAKRYDNLSLELDDMKAKYDTLYKLLLKPDPQPSAPQIWPGQAYFPTQPPAPFRSMSPASYPPYPGYYPSYHGYQGYPDPYLPPHLPPPFQGAPLDQPPAPWAAQPPPPGLEQQAPAPPTQLAPVPSQKTYIELQPPTANTSNLVADLEADLAQELRMEAENTLSPICEPANVAPTPSHRADMHSELPPVKSQKEKVKTKLAPIASQHRAELHQKLAPIPSQREEMPDGWLTLDDEDDEDDVPLSQRLVPKTAVDQEAAQSEIEVAIQKDQTEIPEDKSVRENPEQKKNCPFTEDAEEVIKPTETTNKPLESVPTEESNSKATVEEELDETSIAEEDYMPVDNAETPVEKPYDISQDAIDKMVQEADQDQDTIDRIVQEAVNSFKPQDSVDKLVETTAETANFSFWADSSGMVNSTNLLPTITETNTEKATNEPKKTSEDQASVLETDTVIKIECEVDVLSYDEMKNHADNDDWKKSLTPEEVMRQELAMEEKRLQEEQIKLRMEKESFKQRHADLKRKREEFKVSEKKRIEEKVKRDKAARHEESRVREEARRHEVELARLAEVEARRAVKMAELEARRAAALQKQEEERKRREEQEEAVRKEQERLEEIRRKEVERKQALAKSGKVSRKDLRRSLTGAGPPKRAPAEQASSPPKRFKAPIHTNTTSATDLMSIDLEIEKLKQQPLMSTKHVTANNQQMKTKQTFNQHKTTAPATNLMSIDDDFQLSDDDCQMIPINPKQTQRRPRQHSQGPQVHTLYPPILPSSYGPTTKTIKKPTRTTTQSKPPGPPGPPAQALPRLPKGVAISIAKVIPKPNPLLRPEIQRIARNSNLSVSVAK